MSGDNSDHVAHESEILSDSLLITRPLYKHALLAFVVLSVAAIIWAVFGSIPQRIQGLGEINTTGGLFTVTSTHQGQIRKIKVAVNDQVKENQVLFILEQPELKSSISEMEDSLQLLKDKKEKMMQGNAASLSLKSDVNVIEERRIQLQIQEADKTIAFIKKKIKQNETLHADGLITSSELYDSKTSLATAVSDKANLHELLSSLSLNTQEWKLGKDLGEKDLDIQIKSQEKQLSELKLQYKKSTEVSALKAGEVIQMDMAYGDVVSPGTGLATIEIPDNYDNYKLNLYVPFTSNALIVKGMKVDIEPFTVDRNLYGWLKGTVVNVNKFVSSDESLKSALANTALVQLVSKEGPVYEVTVDLNTDPKTVSGFAWSNKKGPPFKVSVGSLCRAYVDVKDKAPIDYLIPVFKKYFD